jgi:L-ascorbate metabolism protein UlaG (beta-lactamase superfamily)
MVITWLGHSCFLLESDGYRLVIDPYRDVAGYPALHVDAHSVCVSHEHFDHNNRAAVALLPRRENPFQIETIPTFHDECSGAKRGSNTVHLLSAEGLRAVHLGDLGHALHEDAVSRLHGCDVLMVPVGGVYTIDAMQAAALCAQIEPRVILPMHYFDGRCGLPELDTAESFSRLMGKSYPVVRADTDTVEITAQTPPQVILLTCFA